MTPVELSLFVANQFLKRLNNVAKRTDQEGLTSLQCTQCNALSRRTKNLNCKNCQKKKERKVLLMIEFSRCYMQKGSIDRLVWDLSDSLVYDKNRSEDVILSLNNGPMELHQDRMVSMKDTIRFEITQSGFEIKFVSCNQTPQYLCTLYVYPRFYIYRLKSISSTKK